MFSSHLFKDIVIQQDDEIRLKIVGTRVDKNDIVSVLVFNVIVLVIILHWIQCYTLVYQSDVVYPNIREVKNKLFSCFSVCHWIPHG